MRIDIHGLFLITGETQPLAPTSQRAIRERIESALANQSPPIRSVAVTLSDTLDERGLLLKQCRLSVEAADRHRANRTGVAPTIRDALSTACDLLSQDIGRTASTRSRVSRDASPTARNGQR